jgi:hypothetical protein
MSIVPTWRWSAGASPAAPPPCILRSAASRLPCWRRAVVGYGASGRSGGQTIFGLASSQQALAAAVGGEDAHRLFDLSIEALDLTQSLIRDLCASTATTDANHVHVATKPRHLRELEGMGSTTLHGDYGYHVGAPVEPRRTAGARPQRALPCAGCWIRAAGTCIRSSSLRAWHGRPRPQGAKIFQKSAGAAL